MYANHQHSGSQLSSLIQADDLVAVGVERGGGNGGVKCEFTHAVRQKETSTKLIDVSP